MKHFCEVFQWSSIYVRISLLSDVFILEDASLYELKKKDTHQQEEFLWHLLSDLSNNWILKGLFS